MQVTNVKLSKEEMILVNNSQFILTKQIIISKVYALFGQLYEDYTLIIKEKEFRPENEVLHQPAKIYKGEQYNQLPYVLMDYPRFFNKSEAFAIRTFFWWGNFFSITLHLSGSYFERYKDVILKFITRKENDAWFICVNENEWQHDFGEKNYLPVKNCVNDLVLMELLMSKSFIKLAAKIELSEWDVVQQFFSENFGILVEMLMGINFQDDERAL